MLFMLANQVCFFTLSCHGFFWSLLFYRALMQQNISALCSCQVHLFIFFLVTNENRMLEIFLMWLQASVVCLIVILLILYTDVCSQLMLWVMILLKEHSAFFCSCLDGVLYANVEFSVQICSMLAEEMVVMKRRLCFHVTQVFVMLF